MKMKGLSDHLTNATITQSCKDGGEIAGLKPEQCWTTDEIVTSELLGATIPNSVFHQIKMANHVKNVWEKLKKPFQNKSRTLLVDLGRNSRTRVAETVTMYVPTLKSLRSSALGRTVSNDEHMSMLIGSQAL